MKKKKKFEHACFRIFYEKELGTSTSWNKNVANFNVISII